jgi:CHAD domain-containing protein
VTGQSKIHDYANEQMNHLLTRLAFQVHRAAKTPGPDQIHDLRVCIRRFSQGLLLFSDLLPHPEVRKIEKTLKRMLRLTSQIRDRDIALQFLIRARHAAERPRLRKERVAYQLQFTEMVRRWSARDFSVKWRRSLFLQGL